MRRSRGRDIVAVIYKATCQELLLIVQSGHGDPPRSNEHKRILSKAPD